MIVQAQIERRFVWMSLPSAGMSAMGRVRQLAALR